MSIDPLEEIFKDPDRRAKLFLFIAVIRILVTLMIPIGIIIWILRVLGLI